jgi:chromate reductase, NAD(P)H dehydrogenase (quinone)
VAHNEANFRIGTLVQNTINVLGVSGSLRASSYNTALLRAAVKLAPAGMIIEIADIRDIPHYDGDVEEQGFPEAVVAFREKFKRADALLIVTPEYNFSIPGVLKNVIDWLSRPPDQTLTNGKPVAIMGAGGRLGSARAQYHLRQILGCLSMLTVPRPEVFVLNAWEKISADGSIKDPAVDKEIVALLAALANWVAMLRRARPAR